MTQDQIMQLVDEYAVAALMTLADPCLARTEANRTARSAVVAALEALTKDAERYRFIRVGDPDNAVMTWVHGLDDWTPWASPEDADQAIDEAIAAQKEQV